MDRSVVLHQFHQNIGDFKKIFNYIKTQVEESSSPQSYLHIYPELFLTGYPLQDLCLQKSFFDSYMSFIKEINSYFQKLTPSEDYHIMGGLTYKVSKSGFPTQIKNSMYLGIPGKGLERIYNKRLLPSYDIFDESKYFTPGQTRASLRWKNYNIGLLICEDMWTSTHYEADPIKEMVESGENFDLVINISASPFGVRKHENRIEQAQDISHMLKAPFIYTNLVGEEDEILFDGGSFIVRGDDLLTQLPFFKGHKEVLSLEKILEKKEGKELYTQEALETTHSWEDLFKPVLKDNQIASLTEAECEILLDSLIFGLSEYMRKHSFEKYLVALSGGIDSTLALTIAKLALKNYQSIEAIYMPSQYSASKSMTLSQELCDNLEVPLKIMPIKFMHSVARNTIKDHFKEKFEGIADENIQSRLRGTLLYARSNQTGAMVINTSNKSEIAVGYSTLYGDSVGAISVIGDLFKTEVYSLCHFINKKYPDLIPQGIINRPPTAELKADQVDSDSLPPYNILDTILECFLSYRYNRDDLLKMGINQGYIDRVLHLYNRSEFKRKQFCPILKVKTKSFGFGYRVPINKSKEFYFN